MLPVFKNLSSLSKKFTTKKPMPKDFQDKLKGLLDTAEDKLKNKHKVTPAELYSYTTAYHIYFLIYPYSPLSKFYATQGPIRQWHLDW